MLDAHALDKKGDAGDAAVDELLGLYRDRKIRLVLPYSVQVEISHPNTPVDVKQRAAGILFSIEVTLTPDEKAKHAEVRALLQGNAQPEKHAADAFHLVEAAKYGSYFITRERRLHQKQAELRALLPGLWVVTPEEVLELCRAAEND